MVKASVHFLNVFIKICGLLSGNTLACLLAGGCECAYGGNSLKATMTALTILCFFLTPSNPLMKLKNNKRNWNREGRGRFVNSLGGFVEE